MLKLIAVSIWIALVTAAAAYFSAHMMAAPADTGAAPVADLGLEQIETEMTSVPMVRGGAIVGYVIIQLQFEADRAMLAKLKLEPKPFLVDAAFRAIYSSEQADFTRLRASDIDQLTGVIATEANKRMGGELVKQVLISQLNYVRKEDIRTHWIQKQ